MLSKLQEKSFQLQFLKKMKRDQDAHLSFRGKQKADPKKASSPMERMIKEQNKR